MDVLLAFWLTRGSYNWEKSVARDCDMREEDIADSHLHKSDRIYRHARSRWRTIKFLQRHLTTLKSRWRTSVAWVFRQVHDATNDVVTTLVFKFVETVVWPSDDRQWNFQKQAARRTERMQKAPIDSPSFFTFARLADGNSSFLLSLLRLRATNSSIWFFTNTARVLYLAEIRLKVHTDIYECIFNLKSRNNRAEQSRVYNINLYYFVLFLRKSWGGDSDSVG